MRREDESRLIKENSHIMRREDDRPIITREV